MKNFLFFSAMFICIFKSAKAQVITIGVGPDVAITSGKLKNLYSVGVGGTVKGEVKLAPVSVTVQSGYLRFIGKDKRKDIGQVPIKFGLHYKFLSLPLYIEPQAGVDKWVSSGNSSTPFAYAFNLGVKGGSVDLSARYEGTKIGGEQVHFWGIRLAWYFGLL
ncbi:MAG: hypothetical protein PW786_12165 [Arachidicoccus sp.]|nr:hypothetical protein [Arachidicoccus sp.]